MSHVSIHHQTLSRKCHYHLRHPAVSKPSLTINLTRKDFNLANESFQLRRPKKCQAHQRSSFVQLWMRPGLLWKCCTQRASWTPARPVNGATWTAKMVTQGVVLLERAEQPLIQEWRMDYKSCSYKIEVTWTIQLNSSNSSTFYCSRWSTLQPARFTQSRVCPCGLGDESKVASGSVQGITTTGPYDPFPPSIWGHG